MKLKRILAAALAGVMAATSTVVTSVTAGAEDVDLTSSFSTGISATELQNYDTLAVTYKHETTSDSYNANSAIAFVANSVSGMASDISDAKKSTWYQPDNTVIAATWTAQAESTVTVNVADIFSSFTNDSAWSAAFTLESITTTSWNGAVLTKVMGTPKDTTVYEEIELTLADVPTQADNTNVAILIGEGQDLDITGISEKASLRIYYTGGPNTGWGNVQIIDNSTGWSSIADALPSKGNGVDSYGDISISLLENVTKLVLQNNNGGVITKVVLRKPVESGVAPTVYDIDVEVFENATVVAPAEAAEGEEVTVTYTAIAGYSVDSITIKGENGKEIVPIDSIGDEDGSSLTCTFEMPASTVTISAEINKLEVESVTVSPAAQSLVAGATAQLTAVVEPDNAFDTTVTWTSSNTAVATVDQTGKVTAVAAGTATITAEAASGVKGTSAITVTTAEVPATAITLSKTEVALETGASEVITAAVTPSDTTDTITWSSSDETVAAVAGGKITSFKAGTATITATAGTVTATCTVTVTDPEEVLLYGTYSDGKWEQLSDEEIAALGELNTNTVVGDEYLTTQNVLSVQYSAAEKKFRIYQVYSEAALAGKSSASIVVKKGDVALKLTTECVYKNLAADQTAPEGCYYIAWVISEVEDPTAFSYSGITLA